MSVTLKQLLRSTRTPFDQIEHCSAFGSSATAEAARVPASELAKAVILEEDSHYLAVVLPASLHVDLAAVKDYLGHFCGLAIEAEIGRIFDDCQVGSIPAPAQAYGLKVLLDRRLVGLDDVYFQSGDPALLVRLDGRDFAALMSNGSVGSFGEVWADRA